MKIRSRKPAKINSKPVGSVGIASKALANSIGVSVSDLSHYNAGRFDRIASHKVNKIKDYIDQRRSLAVRILAHLADGHVLTRYDATVMGFGLNLWERIREIEGRGAVKLRIKDRVYTFKVRRTEKPGSPMLRYWMDSTEMARAKEFLKLSLTNERKHCKFQRG